MGSSAGDRIIALARLIGPFCGAGIWLSNSGSDLPPAKSLPVM